MPAEIAIRPNLWCGGVFLRAPLPADAAQRLGFGRDPEFRRMVGGDPNTCPELTMDEVSDWFDKACGDRFSWIIDVDRYCVGFFVLRAVDEVNRRARFSIGLFSPEHRGRGIGATATRLVLDDDFEKLGLHRIDLRVLDFNLRAIACYKKCGFVLEGAEREGALIAGEWHTDLVTSILEHEYRTQQHAVTS